jgi:hypothetical protein
LGKTQSMVGGCYNPQWNKNDRRSVDWMSGMMHM